MMNSKWRFQASLFLAAGMLSAQAGTFTSDFNSGDLPPGTHTNANANGGAYLELTGGVGDSGCLKLTKNINSQSGSFILDDLDAGLPIYGFDIKFKLRLGGGTSTPADGMSVCVAPDLGDTSLFGESGAGNGVRFGWDIYSNPDTPPAPRLIVMTGGTVVAWKGYDIASITTSGDINSWWTDVHIRLNPDGSLVFDYKGVNVFTNYFIPGYQTLVDQGVPMRIGFGARTGGLNAHQWIDNLQITTFTQPNVGFSQQPYSQKVLQGESAVFDVRITNPNGVTLQWFRDGTAIAGATSETLIVPNVTSADSGKKFKCVATGPNNVATSAEVTLTVVTLTLPTTPQLSFNFNDGATPANTTLVGSAAVDGTGGGVTNSGALKITTAVNGVSGALVVSDPNAGAPVYGFTAKFQALVAGGTTPPADGFAVAFGSDIPDSPTGDFDAGLGLGNGLRVTFDIYNNDSVFGYPQYEGQQPAPSIDVRLGSQVLGSVQLPLSFLETPWDTGTQTGTYGNTIIQLTTDGTLNVVYRGALIFDKLPIPGFSSLSGGKFAIAARTGGLNENVWVDNVELTTVLTPGALRIVSPPTAQTVLVGRPATFTVGVNDPAGVTYQWLRGGTAISGATDSAYTLPTAALTDQGALFSVQATKSGTTVTSSQVALTVVNLTAPATPTVTYDFNNGQVPAGTAVYGAGDTGAGLPPGGYIAANGGVGDSGVLKITDAVNGQQGAFVIQPLQGGAQISSIAAAFDVRIGGGSSTPADGWSFNWAANLTDGVGGNEGGNGNNLSVCMRTYIGSGDTDNPPSPYIGIRYKGALVASIQTPAAQLVTDPDYRTVLLRVDPDGKLFLAYGDRVLWNGLQLPNYTFLANGKFGIYGRTGGLNANQWFDNIRIQAIKSSGPLTVTAPPTDALVIVGSTAKFTVGLSDPAGATYQWYKNNTAISGATTSAYTTPATALADSGALFKVTATSPNGTATSPNAVLTVVSPITISNPIMTYNFNDCAQPADTILTGPAYIACNGGVSDSGVLHLTDTTASQQGSFIMPDFNTNAPIKAITASLAVRIADGSGTPADGISFSWGSSNSIPDTANFGEAGVGDGVRVSLVTWAGNPEAPAFAVWYNNNRLVNKLVPYSSIFTGDLSTDPLQQYANMLVRVNENGTLDLQYKGQAIFNALPLPGYAPIVGGRFALGGRTGGEYETHWVDNLQIATTPGLVRIPIDFARTAGGGLRITWSSTFFKLQSTPTLVPASWTDVAGAVSPYTVTIGSGSLFYRLAPAQ